MGRPPVSGAAAGLADRLRAATRDQHDAAENHGFQRALVAGEVPREALVVHQSGLLDLVRVIEARLRGCGLEWRPLADAMGAHGDRLAADLDGLRDGGPPVAGSPAVRAFAEALGGDAWSPGAALGAFYVIEGSMNGNRFIRRALAEARPELAADLRYFDPYGDDQRRRWKEFRARVDRLGGTLADPGEAVRAARATFELAAALAGEAQEAVGTKGGSTGERAVA